MTEDLSRTQSILLCGGKIAQDVARWLLTGCEHMLRVRLVVYLRHSIIKCMRSLVPSCISGSTSETTVGSIPQNRCFLVYSVPISCCFVLRDAKCSFHYQLLMELTSECAVSVSKCLFNHSIYQVSHFLS